MFHSITEGDIELHLLEEHIAPVLFALTEQNREHLRQWLPWVDDNLTQVDTRAFIEDSRASYADKEGLDAGIWHQGRLVGVIGFYDLNWTNRRACIGYWLGALFQGQGIMTRSCRALVDYGFHQFNLNRVEIRCAPENRRRRAIPERLGFRQEGIIRQVQWLYDHFVDHVVYGMLSSEWPQEKRP